jgi:hypothetical protein
MTIPFSAAKKTGVLRAPGLVQVTQLVDIEAEIKLLLQDWHSWPPG